MYVYCFTYTVFKSRNTHIKPKIRSIQTRISFLYLYLTNTLMDIKGFSLQRVLGFHLKFTFFVFKACNIIYFV